MYFFDWVFFSPCSSPFTRTVSSTDEIPPTPDIMEHVTHFQTPTPRCLELSPVSSLRSELFDQGHRKSVSRQSPSTVLGSNHHEPEMSPIVPMELSEPSSPVTERSPRYSDQEKHHLAYVDIPASQNSSQGDPPFMTQSQPALSESSSHSPGGARWLPQPTSGPAHPGNPELPAPKLSDNSLHKICSELDTDHSLGLTFTQSPISRVPRFEGLVTETFMEEDRDCRANGTPRRPIKWETTMQNRFPSLPLAAFDGLFLLMHIMLLPTPQSTCLVGRQRLKANCYGVTSSVKRTTLISSSLHIDLEPRIAKISSPKSIGSCLKRNQNGTSTATCA